jgi:hypothetical protein
MSNDNVGQSTVKSLYKTFCKNNADVVFPSLKAFVRGLRKSGTDDEKLLATEWFANKSGILERAAGKERFKNKGGRIALERAASKAARRKKAGPQKAATTSA